MSTPGFAAEASLYKTRQVYRGFGPGLGRDAALNVVPQLSCSDTCWVYYGLCLLGSGGNPLAAAACFAGFLFCEVTCPSGGGGGGGGGPLCCPQGTTCRCGGTCVPGKGCVDGVCLGPHQQCP